MKIVVIDPRRTATCRDRRPASGDRAGRRRRAVQRAAGASRHDAARSTPTMSRATRRGFDEALGRMQRAFRCRARASIDRRAGRCRLLATFYDCSPRPSAPSRSSARASTSRRGHRQGQRDHQLPPRDRPHRQAGHGAVLGHRPAQRHGRARGRRARQPARRAYGARERRRIATACSASGRRRRSPTRPGLKAVDMFDAVADGRIKALWIMATNPVGSHARRRRGCATALAGLPASSSSPTSSRTPTRRRYAHVLLPAAAWGEKDGTVTNSERRISRQRAFLPPPGEARPDWWIVAEVARRMGFGEAFAYRIAGRDLSRACALSGFENDGQRAFRHRRPRGPVGRRLRRAGARAMAGPRRRRCRGARALLRRRRILHRRTAGPASSPCGAPAAATCRSTPAIPWRSTPAACATSGTP